MDRENPFAPPSDPDATAVHEARPTAPARAPQPPRTPTPHAPMPNPRAARATSDDISNRAHSPLASGLAAARTLPPLDFNWQANLGAGSDNPLISAARLIFAVVGRLRLTTQAPQVGVFRNHLIQQIGEFDQVLMRARVPREIAVSARYALCSFIDETVMSTPWGSVSDWQQHTLLTYFHQEGWGGEKFFEIVRQALGDPARFLHLIEFLFLCLCFGFHGRYRVLNQGQAQLAEVQAALYRAIRGQRGDDERDLSVRWEGVVDKRNPLIRFVPLWVIGAVCAALLAAIFLGFHLLLGAQSTPMEKAVSAIGRAEFAIPNAAPPIAVPLGVTRLRSFLEDEIEEGLVTVEETPDRAIVRLNSDRCFTSGSATVEAEFMPTLQRIAAEINQVQGPVEVIGHSDNVPLKSLRFSSNLALSRARADGVLAALVSYGVPASRLSADGRADSEPLADNAIPAGRGLNRRVEIVVFEGTAAMSGVTAPAGR